MREILYYIFIYRVTTAKLITVFYPSYVKHDELTIAGPFRDGRKRR